jgi:hypothetical protein
MKDCDACKSAPATWKTQTVWLSSNRISTVFWCDECMQIVFEKEKNNGKAAIVLFEQLERESHE